MAIDRACLRWRKSNKYAIEMYVGVMGYIFHTLSPSLLQYHLLVVGKFFKLFTELFYNVLQHLLWAGAEREKERGKSNIHNEIKYLNSINESKFLMKLFQSPRLFFPKLGGKSSDFY